MIPGIRITAGLGTGEAGDEVTSGSWLFAIESTGGKDATITVRIIDI
jgi:hypothetical protein